ncbi:MAG TPA: hypothetical protein VGL39_08340 [Jatrophihabitantaceae bacterium]|jgi:hypothetical protein
MNDAEFERQLRASLRFGAEQVRIPEVGFDPLTLDEAFEDEVRTGLRDAAAQPLEHGPPVIPRRPARPRRRWLFEGLAAAAVAGVVALALGLGLFARERNHLSGPDGGAPSAPRTWQVSVGMVPSPMVGEMNRGNSNEFTAPAYSRVTLSITIAPQHPDGKTYLYRSIDNGVWELLGPHNTDATSRELLRVPTPAAGQVAACRLYVAPADDHAGTYSSPIYLYGT